MFAEPFKVIVPLDANYDGAMARLFNFDTGATIDSSLVVDNSATFTGMIDEPVLANVVVEDVRLPVFILESGTISFNKNNRAFGSMLNDQCNVLFNQIAELYGALQRASSAVEVKKIEDRYAALLDSAMQANSDNALGYMAFLNTGIGGAGAAELREHFKKYPEFARYQRSARMLEQAERRDATQPGRKFVDFEVTYDGKTQKLSDYVGRGHYTLVDFWASWCGPCMKQLPVLKEIYNKYKDDNLQVLGVAVWDKPADSERAIKSHDLPWPNIIDAQSIPSDIYAFTGIPCIILFGPDGTILSRGKQGDELKAAVAAALGK